ncbi:MAG: hypothetical protein SGI92_29610 [Bryobacteraceae bacterium]|nr:hypothetical protein [Bryobacteraceae bacterium]
MQMLALVWGILAIFGFAIAFIPCLGSLNWINIPFALVGTVISLLARNTASPNSSGVATTALILNLIAVVIGFLRLKAGLFLF